MTVLRNIFTYASALLAAGAGLTGAIPLNRNMLHFKRQAAASGLNDMDILQFALTLENLESTFYKQGFAMFPPSDFMALGLSQASIDTLNAIASTENTHVTTLAGVITKAGGTPVQPCTYNFGFTDAAGMVATARVLEAVGISAYLGAAPLISDKTILSAAASIVTVESRHQTFIRTAVQAAPVPQAFDVAISAQQIFTIASQFITSCPTGSSLTFVTSLPPLTIQGAATATAGSVLRMAAPAGMPASGVNCAFTGGDTGTMFAPFNNGACTVPTGMGGEVFVVLTTTSSGTVADSSVMAGPAVLSLT